MDSTREGSVRLVLAETIGGLWQPAEMKREEEEHLEWLDIKAFLDPVCPTQAAQPKTMAR